MSDPDPVTVLFAGKDRANLCLLEDMLASGGAGRFEVVPVSLADVAGQPSAARAEVLLIDLELDVVTSVERMERLRKLSAEFPVVVWMPAGQEDLASELLRVGVQDCVSKEEAAPAVMALALRRAIARQAAVSAIRAQAREASDLITSLRNGEVDAILTNGGRSEALRLLDEKRIREGEKLLLQFGIANDELARSNSELEEFAYMVSHDLQAPLRAIDQLSKWIAQDLGDRLEGETRENMELLRKRVDRMKRLIDDLLQYSRAGRAEVKVEPVDAAELLAEIERSIQPPAGFQVVACDGLPVFETGRTALTQVLQNLIENAIKHHDREEGWVQVSVLDREDRYEFIVADDGPGIPPEFRDKAFQMLRTLRSRDQVEGSGIGLALVKKLVEKQGGRIWIDSGAGGRGAIFHFEWRR